MCKIKFMRPEVLSSVEDNCDLIDKTSFLEISETNMLYLVGLGLGDPSDITLKGLDIVKKCNHVYLESYTSIMGVNVDEMSSFFGKEILIADRDLVEQGADEILEKARDTDVAFLVIGDPFGATTHTDLVLRAKSMQIGCQVIHNASILNAVGACGLQLYSFGETVSIPFWTDTWKPDSFFHKICENKRRGLHTLCLLDIKVKEPNLESMIKGKIKYDPPRFMSVCQAADQLVQIIDNLAQTDHGDVVVRKEDLCVGVARLGSTSQTILACSLQEMCEQDLGPPLHSLVICGKMHPLESDFLQEFLKKETEPGINSKPM